VARRFHVKALAPGEVALDSAESRHARDVLRLAPSAAVDLFDDAGQTARGEIIATEPDVLIRVDYVDDATAASMRLVVASAVPKGSRADWMVEKLAELGVDCFIPLAAARSVVLPEGRGKIGRWERIGLEAAKQSHRQGVMKIEPLCDVGMLLKRPELRGAWCLATEPGSIAVQSALGELGDRSSVTVLIGPEGGWTAQEQQLFSTAGIISVRLTPSILRIETAALAIAAIVLAR
jgi:16S rRNA (uracil1498-N3)-methyltransferase